MNSVGDEEYENGGNSNDWGVRGRSLKAIKDGSIRSRAASLFLLIDWCGYMIEFVMLFWYRGVVYICMYVYCTFIESSRD